MSCETTEGTKTTEGNIIWLGNIWSQWGYNFFVFYLAFKLLLYFEEVDQGDDFDLF